MDSPGLIVILGAPNDSAGKLSLMAQGRVQLGYELYLRYQAAGYRLLLTGGYGPHFNTTDKPHAYYAWCWLRQFGVSAEAFVEFAESCNTLDDARQAAPIIARAGGQRLLIVTSDFHLARARFVFQRHFPQHELLFFSAPYLTTCPPAEQERLFAHEARALAELRQGGL